jgi:hypothetical protein
MRKLIFLIGLVLSVGVQAEIYKHVDANGRVTYSNTPSPGAVQITLEPAVESSGQAASPATKTGPSPEEKLRQEREKQQQAIAERRARLEDELAAEREALEQAREKYAEAEKNPEMINNIVDESGQAVLGAKEGDTIVGADGQPVKNADGSIAKYKKKRGRNMAKYADKLNQISEEIKMHEQKIEELEGELSRL